MPPLTRQRKGTHLLSSHQSPCRITITYQHPLASAAIAAPALTGHFSTAKVFLKEMPPMSASGEQRRTKSPSKQGSRRRSSHALPPQKKVAAVRDPRVTGQQPLAPRYKHPPPRRHHRPLQSRITRPHHLQRLRTTAPPRGPATPPKRRLLRHQEVAEVRPPPRRRSAVQHRAGRGKGIAQSRPARLNPSPTAPTGGGGEPPQGPQWSPSPSTLREPQGVKITPYHSPSASRLTVCAVQRCRGGPGPWRSATRENSAPGRN